MKAKKPKRAQQKVRKKTGPEPERLKIDGDWMDAVDVALRKQRPKEGWPK